MARYRNIGESVVAGAQPGDEFVWEYTPEQEAALFEGGHIEALPDPPKPAPKPAPKEE